MRRLIGNCWRVVVEAAILPVANAFVVLLLFSSLFAVMSVMFFKEKDTSQGLFDNFSIALFTMVTYLQLAFLASATQAGFY